jgi:hypothetical protein
MRAPLSQSKIIQLRRDSRKAMVVASGVIAEVRKRCNSCCFQSVVLNAALSVNIFTQVGKFRLDPLKRSSCLARRN